ncbi:hypothetical protein [Solicola gregarius]|uniref:Uncharacterized protein n=1 Tax=Solicola gregarius TaxID=2908642 RepID=A0AA46YMP5_9ACTN|nr:hypothetical protein [Solicola gregarius]UYM05923.1 hypothetical protein L0C25_02290 [Solicola gregarius]
MQRQIEHREAAGDVEYVGDLADRELGDLGCAVAAVAMDALGTWRQWPTRRPVGVGCGVVQIGGGVFDTIGSNGR